MILQMRDKNILSALARYGVLSTKQISALFFANIAHTTVMKRLRILEIEGVVLRSSGLPNAMSAWSLSLNGARLIGADEPSRYVNRNTLLHEVGVSELRLAIEKVGFGENWTTEVELKRQFNLNSKYAEDRVFNVPDGLFIAQRDAAGVVAAELELNAKSHQRYRKILSQYAEKDSIKWIWYIAKTQAIGKTVMDQWQKTRKYNNSPILLISHFGEVLESPRDCFLNFCDGKKLHLSEYFSLPKMQVKSEVSDDTTTHELSNFSDKPLSRHEIQNSIEKQELNAAPDF